MEIIRISATWCSSCLITYKSYKKLKEKYLDIKFSEYDYDEDDIDKFNVGNILPVIIIYKDDKEIKRIVGEKSEEELFKEVEDCYEENK